MAFNGLAFGLPFTMNSVEGTEATLFVAASASRAGWRRALIALAAAVVTLVPFGLLLWVAFRFVGPEYLDYTIALVIFLLGAREVREGLEERPRRGGRADPGATEQIGLAPASAASVRQFRSQHGLADGDVIDDAVRAAVRALRAEAGYTSVDPYVFGVDPADAEMVRAFQERHGLPVSGDVDAMTRGALRVAQQQGLLDPRDPSAVGRFQRDHGLEVTGGMDEQTRVAADTVRAEGATTLSERDGGSVRVDPGTAYRELDIADPASIRRLQRSLGLRPTGAIGEETRGALLALRVRIPVDTAEEDGHRLVPDPVDLDAVKMFQRRYGLEPHGRIDERTQQAARYARDHDVDVDPTDELSIRRFQSEHGVEPDGVIGARTQTALLAVRSERFPDDEKARRKRYGDIVAGNGAGPVLDVDVADADAVRSFQRRHHLTTDGVIGPETREAMAVALLDRRREGPRQGAHNRTDGKARGPVTRMRDLLGDAWPAYVGVLLESGEAVLYSFAVASSKFAVMPAVLGAGIGFAWPWTVLPVVRKVTRRVPEWKQELGIGLILVGVASAFGLLHMVGVFG